MPSLLLRGACAPRAAWVARRRNFRYFRPFFFPAQSAEFWFSKSTPQIGQGPGVESQAAGSLLRCPGQICHSVDFCWGGNFKKMLLFGATIFFLKLPPPPHPDTQELWCFPPICFLAWPKSDALGTASLSLGGRAHLQPIPTDGTHPSCLGKLAVLSVCASPAQWTGCCIQTALSFLEP